MNRQVNKPYRSRSGSKESGSDRRSRSRSRQRSESIPEVQPTKCLSIEGQVNLQQAHQVFDDMSIRAGTSLPDQIEASNGLFFIRYPSVVASTKVYTFAKGKVVLDGTQYRMDYYPRRENALAQDWTCNKCNYTNFSRRSNCNRCENFRNSECRPVLVTNSAEQGQALQNREEINTCSLMIKGQIIATIDETVLLGIFQQLVPIKDIRMIKNRMTGTNKDFAFLEFYDAQQAMVAFRQASNPAFKVLGQPISCRYSKNRKQEAGQFGLSRNQSGYNKARRPIPTQNYCQIQRQKEIKQQKQRQIITIQKLKEKKDLEMKKQHQNALQKELTSEQVRRKQAQLQMKRWQKSKKVQVEPVSLMYICPLCVRKFKDQQQLKNHQEKSMMHLRSYNKLVR